MFTFLHLISLEPIEWSEAVETTEECTPYTGDVVTEALATAQAVVVLLTPDDIAQLHPKYHGENDPDYETRPNLQPRPNVIYEAGQAMARIPDRTIFVEFGKVRPFSDLSGRNVIRASDNQEWRDELLRRLQTAHCAVKPRHGWLTEGEFELPDEISNFKDASYLKLEHCWRVAENELIGDFGEYVKNGAWAIDTAISDLKGIHGPYIRLEPNIYRATFRLKIGDIRGEDVRFAYIDVTSRYARKVFAQRTLTVTDFDESDKYQDFNLDFELTKPDINFEFRVRTYGKGMAKTRLVFDYVELKSQ